ncbi:hypothetical protein NBRC116586_03380 [Pseudooceanicola nitratireducens]|uniref:hypothetical protein n=1 Tax=Pseudooceanicola nitratireducens TaxID=517719 RepID=UPI003106801F
MGRQIRQASTLAAALLTGAIAGPVRADVTPAQVWDQWAGYLSSFGYTVEFEPVVDGDNLHFPVFEMTMYIPGDKATGVKGGTVTINMGELALVDLGDGTVSIELPGKMPIAVAGDGPGDDDFTADLTLTAMGHRTIASGDPGDITYDFSAETLGVTLDQVSGKDGPSRMPGTVAITMEGASGVNRLASDNGVTRINQALKMDRLAYDVAISDPSSGHSGKVMWQGEITGLTTSSRGVVPPEVNPLAIDRALANGYIVNTLIEFDAGNGVVGYADEKSETRMATTSQGGTFGLGMSATGLEYSVLSRDVSISLSGTEVPFPLNTNAGALGLGIQLPVIAGALEQPFGASITVTDLDVPEAVWMMADPTNSLPHDPVTMEVALSGKTRLFTDIMNEAAMRRLDKTGGAPGELTALALEALRIRAAGAMIEASADLDIDNTKVSMFHPNMPAFGGTADVTLTGVTTLLNKLGQLGMIPMQHALIGAGMIQQLGRQGDEADEFSADIRLSPAGTLTINDTPFPLQ